MVKTYLRYRHTDTFGLIASPGGGVAASPDGQLVFSPQLSDVGVFSLRRGVQVATLRPPGASGERPFAEVTRLCASPRGASLAVGYSDGMVRTFDTDGAALALTLSGHRRAVGALAFSADGTRLASGSRDTDVILWDAVGEVGLARLRGHRDEVSGLCFLSRRLLATCGKDTLLKVWDLDALACVQTVVGARCELWGLALTDDGSRLLAVGSDSRLRVWAVGAGAGAPPPGAMADGAAEEEGPLVAMGSIARTSAERGVAIATGAGGVFAVQSAGKTVEVFRRRGAGEARARVLRRLRRAREKLHKRERGAGGRAGGGVEGAAPGAGGAVGGEEEEEEDDGYGGGLPVGTSLAAVDAQIAALMEAEAAAEAAEGAGAAAPQARPRDATTAGDEFECVGLAQGGGRVSGAAVLAPARDGALQLLLALGDNSMEVHTLGSGGGDGGGRGAGEAPVQLTVTAASGATLPLAQLSRTLGQGGHRSDVRALAVSSDGALLLSGSADAAKVWNARSGACLRTLPCKGTLVVSVAFGPGDKHALLGCKDGSLKLFDLASGDLLQELPGAHGGPVWALCVRPDKRGAASGSSDKEVKFWEFEARGALLALVHVRTLRVGDEVLALRYSRHADPQKLLLAVALLDATVKVFFEDTLKFFLSLYGHKLPVLAMDVSADGTLLVTASSDKNVKLWGLDFGVRSCCTQMPLPPHLFLPSPPPHSLISQDCHKSFFAHADAVTSVGFVANTHYFFTGSKDRTVKYWDGDRFECILTLGDVHGGEVWALCVSGDGTFFASGGADRSLRVWRRTEEQVFLEEEREREMGAALEREAGGLGAEGEGVAAGADAVGPVGADGAALPSGEGEGRVVTAPLGAGGGDAPPTALVAHATRDSVRAGEALTDALALAEGELLAWAEYAADLASAEAAGEGAGAVEPPPRNPELLGLTPTRHVLKALRAVPPGDVDQVLLVLPFSSAVSLMRMLVACLGRGASVELCTRACLLLLRLHGAQLAAAPRHAPLLRALRDGALAAVGAAKDVVGFNAAALEAWGEELRGEAAAALAFGKVLSEDAGGDGGAGKKEEPLVSMGKRQKVRLL
jgi:U3 small nucleolar RNA-associated protein 12